ncbi:hypothetical protein N656DRAFT_841509 [Canariomyces notabilis]|uniref:Uncharacterized protein n=1 Tax=Canariomyces notabilis TaxID=2074819 RepID=A0AAN6TK57_9PEZI|nr:hypothetical protein N656DRAFT_841509 [Canariomyces arenarius]
MAAILYRPAVLPVQTPAPTVFVPPLRGLARRFDNTTSTASAPSPTRDCSNFNGFDTCSASGDYGSCLASNDVAFCNCNNGIQYLDCVSAAIDSAGCQGAVAGVGSDWGAYERNWYQTACPTTPPAAVMTQLPQPSSVSLDLEPVAVVTPSAPITEAPTPIVQPSFTDGGELLAGDCKSTSYTLVDGGDMVFYAAFVGCNADRPQCCPWNVSTGASQPDNSPALEVTDAPPGRVAEPGQFPIPADHAKANLERCPQDYYSVSGQCCPNGYYKFTRLVAYQTPCFSSFKERATPPQITAGLAANPKNSALPTSAVVNVAWAMGFNTSGDSNPPLSTGASIGIGVGAGVLAISIGVLAAFLIFRWRRNKKAKAAEGVQEQQAATQFDPYQQGMTYQPGYHAPPGSPPPQTVSMAHPMSPPAEYKYSPPSASPYGGGGGGAGGWDQSQGYGFPHPQQYPHQQMGSYGGQAYR